MSARIARLLGLATLQGPPTTGRRKFGVPPGGAFDQEALRAANALVGNPPDLLTIELSNAPIELVLHPPRLIAVVGLDRANRAEIAERLEIPASRVSPRSYVAVQGGWMGEGGQTMRLGDTLEWGRAQGDPRAPAPIGSFRVGPIQIALGPQPIVDVTGQPFRVSVASDRVGIRLDGLPPMEIPELVSEPACVGAIQLTPSGQLIVIGPDGPTIGGYPKVAVVKAHEIDRLAHLPPGREVIFFV